jgi:outer membrane protein TolC
MTDLLSEQEKSSIIKDVVSSYERMAVVSVSEDVISNTESYLIEQEKFVNKALANGLATDLDLQRINLAKEKLKEKQIELSSARKLLAARLSQLSGLPANELENIKPTLELFAYTDSVFSVNNRSDLQAIDHAISASDLNQKIQYTDYIPKVFAFGKKELITDDLSAFDPQWYVGVGLRWNIFDHFTAHQNAQKAKLDELILEDKKSEAVDLLNLGMQRAKFNLEKNQQLAEVASKEVEFAEKSYRLSLKEYQNGLIPVQTHLESINELENAKLNNIQAIYEQRMSVVEIYNITGNLIQAAEKVLGINTEN